MNSREVAKIFGLAEQTIRQWADRGCPHRRTGRSLDFDMAEVVDWRVRDLRGAEGGADTYKLAQERLATEKADELAMKNAVTRGELVRAEAMLRLWSSALIGFKDRLRFGVRGLAGRVRAAALKGETEAQIAATMLDEIDGALADLAATKFDVAPEPEPETAEEPTPAPEPVKAPPVRKRGPGRPRKVRAKAA